MENAKSSLKKTHPNFTANTDEPVGTVMIGTDHQPICVPGNTMITFHVKLPRLTIKSYVC